MRSLIRFPARRITLGAAAVVLLSVLAVAVTGGPAAAQRSSPKLKLVRTNPVTVDGSGFTPRRHVRVDLTAQRDFVRDPLASASGSFSATFPTMVDRCTSWSVVARQGQASVRLHNPRPECAPASTP